MSQRILDALKALDAKNDNHWTADGLPRLDTVKMLAADQTLSREAVSAAGPGFTRDSAVGYTLPEPDSAGKGVPAAVVGVPTPAAASAAASAAAPALGEGGGGTFPDDKAKQPKVASTGSATNEVEAVAAELEATRNEIVRVRAHLAEGIAYLKTLVAREDALSARLEAEGPKDDNPSAIRAYLDAQVRKGEERAARKQLVADSGIGPQLKALAQDLKSPLDNAMARKTGRGSQRPVLPKA